MRTIEIKLYKFDELSKEAQQKAIESLFDINIDYNWWEGVYEDAKNIGIKINSFDIERNQCDVSLLPDIDFFNVHQSILESHGESTETYAIAKKMGAMTVSQVMLKLSTAYLELLKQEYDYLTSYEVIKDSIIINEYEFTEDGKLY